MMGCITSFCKLTNSSENITYGTSFEESQFRMFILIRKIILGIRHLMIILPSSKKETLKRVHREDTVTENLPYYTDSLNVSTSPSNGYI